MIRPTVHSSGTGYNDLCIFMLPFFPSLCSTRLSFSGSLERFEVLFNAVSNREGRREDQPVFTFVPLKPHNNSSKVDDHCYNVTRFNLCILFVLSNRREKSSTEHSNNQFTLSEIHNLIIFNRSTETLKSHRGFNDRRGIFRKTFFFLH